MIEAKLTCYDKGFELNTKMYLAGLPSTGDIVTVGDKEYEVMFRVFNAEIGCTSTEPAVAIRLKIQ